MGWQDAGIYLCQLAVHPPSLIWTRLDIDPPVVHILDSEEAPVWELHYDVGTTVEMVCRVKRPPLQGKHYFYVLLVKFMFSEKATKNYKIFTEDLTFT